MGIIEQTGRVLWTLLGYMVLLTCAGSMALREGQWMTVYDAVISVTVFTMLTGKYLEFRSALSQGPERANAVWQGFHRYVNILMASTITLWLGAKWFAMS